MQLGKDLFLAGEDLADLLEKERPAQRRADVPRALEKEQAVVDLLDRLDDRRLQEKKEQQEKNE